MSDNPLVTIKADDLYRAIKNVLPFAAEGGNRPAISGLHVVVDRDCVWTVCCDPFSLAIDRAALDGEWQGPAWAVTIPRESVDVLIRTLGQVKKELPRLTVLLAPDAIAITRLHTRIEYTAIEGYPDFRTVIPKGDGVPTERVVLSQMLVKRLHAVHSWETGAIEYYFHEARQPVECQIGRTFRAFLMPMLVPNAQRLTGVPPRVSAPEHVPEAVAS